MAFHHAKRNDTDASVLLEEVTGSARPSADNLTRVLAHGCLAAIAARRGDGEAAGRHGREAVRAADEATGLAVSHRLTGDLPEAEAAALDALECARSAQDLLETAAALLYLTSTDSRDGRTANAPTRAGQAAGLITPFPGPGILAAQPGGNRAPGRPSAPEPAPRGRSRRPDGLTGREAEILHLAANGCSNQETAARLAVSVRAVERHLQNAYRKIGVRNHAGAVAYTARTGPS
jgi:DNA-binding CsgD family transcriptional regulator